MRKYNKTVYILGAGFSMDANAPSQERIVEKIFELHNINPLNFNHGCVDEFKSFLTNSLSIPETLHSKVPLEDIFTPLDRCLIDGMTFRDLSLKDIRAKRDLISYLIATTLDLLLKKPDKRYVNKFAKYLVKESSKRRNRKYSGFDPVSVISTNWDILLDNSIKEQIDKHYKKAVVDYCCYISSYDKDDKSIKPGLEMLGMGGFNVKLLKLHGSLNWLQCPNCHRLYVRFDEKIGMRAFIDPKNCWHCDENFGELESHKLISNSIMPTFMKDLSNPQYKIIWQNAAIEISEASKIIFIGYSLPQADFEMRQLLSRMVRKDAKVEVVSFGKSDNDENIKMISNRYKVFFGNRFKEPIYWKGAKKYVNEIFKNLKA
jgi:hypothetical protein